MVWIPDILIEYRGMSVVTALFFSGLFLLYTAGWMYLRERFASITKALDAYEVKMQAAHDDIASIRTDIAVMRSIMEVRK